ncbi:hypothetical protein ACTOV4_10130 [Brucella sp. C7-11G]
MTSRPLSRTVFGLLLLMPAVYLLLCGMLANYLALNWPSLFAVLVASLFGLTVGFFAIRTGVIAAFAFRACLKGGAQ